MFLFAFSLCEGMREKNEQGQMQAACIKAAVLASLPLNSAVKEGKNKKNKEMTKYCYLLVICSSQSAPFEISRGDIFQLTQCQRD